MSTYLQLLYVGVGDKVLLSKISVIIKIYIQMNVKQWQSHMGTTILNCKTIMQCIMIK
jgi:hypothetical protein